MITESIDEVLLHSQAPLRRLNGRMPKRNLNLFDRRPALVSEFCEGTPHVAPSKGQYFNRTIRGRYPYRQILGSNPVLPITEVAARCDR